MPTRHGGRQLNIGALHTDSVEIPERRWESGACFSNPDGTRTYLCHGSPVHYDDGTGWQEIDTRWEVDDSIVGYRMTKAKYRAFCRRRFNPTTTPLVRLERGSHWITYKPVALAWLNAAGDQQIIATPQNVQGVVTESGADALVQTGAIEWADAFGPGLSFRFDPSTHFFGKELIIRSKEDVALPTISGVPYLAIVMEFDSDLLPELDGVQWDMATLKDTLENVEFRDSARELVARWMKPSAVDANGESTNGLIRTRAQNGKLFVAVGVSGAWMNNASYPVRVDPTVNYNPPTGTSNDGYIYGYTSTYSDGSTGARDVSAYSDDVATSCTVGQRYNSPSYYVWRAYYEFDTSGITDTDNVTQANLNMTCISDLSTTDFSVRIHKHEWGSPLSADNREANFDGALASTYDADWRGTSGMSPNTNYASANLDASWVKKDATTRYAILSSRDVAGNTPTGYERISLASQNHTTASYRPYLAVTAEAGGEPPAGAKITLMHYYQQAIGAI
jgi:hypothetical protein